MSVWELSIWKSHFEFNYEEAEFGPTGLTCDRVEDWGKKNFVIR